MQVTAYHGTGFLFDAFNLDNARVKNDYYGGQAYFTDNINIAKQYADAMYKTAKSKTNLALKVVYRVSLSFKKLFDVDEKFTGKKLLDFIGSNVEGFARSAGLLRLGVDKYQIIADLKSGNEELDGDTIFKGLSGGMQNTTNARNILIRKGYDGLRYNGGKVMTFGSQNHNVYIPYNQNQINIENVIKII